MSFMCLYTYFCGDLGFLAIHLLFPFFPPQNYFFSAQFLVNIRFLWLLLGTVVKIIKATFSTLKSSTVKDKGRKSWEVWMTQWNIDDNLWDFSKVWEPLVFVVNFLTWGTKFVQKTKLPTVLTMCLYYFQRIYTNMECKTNQSMKNYH